MHLPIHKVPLETNPDFLGAIAAQVEMSRPELRRKDTEIDVNSKFAFIMPDLSLLKPRSGTSANSICIEIKVSECTCIIFPVVPSITLG